MRITPDDGASNVAQASASPSGLEPEKQRRCALTGLRGERQALLRLVAGPDGTLWPDLAARLPGRGVWVVPDRDIIAKALANGKLQRAATHVLKTKVIAPATLADTILEGLQKRALGRLGLEHRAGHLIFGSEKLLRSIGGHRLFLLLSAADAAPDSIRKLRGAQLAAAFGESFSLPASRDELSRAVGRDNTPYCGVRDAGAARRIRRDLERWLAYLGPERDKFGNRLIPACQTDKGQE